MDVCTRFYKEAVLVIFAISLAACSQNSVPGNASPSDLQQYSAQTLTASPDDAAAIQHVYWSFFGFNNLQTIPQLEKASLPLARTSKATKIYGNSGNTLNLAAGMRVENGKLWVLAAPTGQENPGDVLVFALPMTSASRPLFTFTLAGTSDPDNLTFDAAGNLWINSHGNSNVLEYTGPFTSSGTLTAALTLSLGITQAEGIAFDSSGNLYVSNASTTGMNSIAVFLAPISNKPPSFFLHGLTGPGIGLIFDGQGNLYAATKPSNGVGTGIARYNSNNLGSGATPNIIDTKSHISYESAFAFDLAGNLYEADCGSPAGIHVYPTGTQAFSATMTPSVTYTDKFTKSTGCVWGIAIK